MNEMIGSFRNALRELLPEINADIEKYRKGNFKIKVIGKDGKPLPATVKVEQKGHLFDFGTSALMLGAMGDKEKEYRDAISELFNFVTTTFCWNITETEPGKYRFEEGSEEIYRRPPADRVLAFAKERGLRAKGQPLFCGRWCPEWVPKDIEELKRLWIGYVREVARRYDGEFCLFDVVNESYQTKGSWKNMDWLPMPVEEFVAWLLRTAGGIFSEKTVMERNETTHVNYGEYAEIYYNENKRLLEEGVRLDSIGFQFHFFNGASCMNSLVSQSGAASLKNIYAAYHRMSTLGVPLYITEITIPTVYKDMTAEEGEALQAEILEALYRLWFSIPNMRGVVYWNLKDGDAWGNEGNCRGCLIDEFMRKKKSYYALEHLIKREWNTSFNAKTDECGELEFKGFYGDYELTVTTDGGERKRVSFTLDEDGGELTLLAE